MNLKTIRLLAGWGLLGWTTATAVPVLSPITGSLTMTSTQGVYLQGTATPLTIYNTTGLDFNDGDPNDYPVVATNATVAAASGDFVSLLNTAGQVRDFTFAAPPGGEYAVWTAGSFSFYLTSVQIDVNAPWLRVFGEGWVESPDYEETLGNFTLNVLASRTLTQVRGFNLHWVATGPLIQTSAFTLNNVVQVEEGVPVMELLGLAGGALGGCWLVVRRGRRRQAPPPVALAQPVG
ncbi:MAG: hypothetical protein ACKOUK_03425 [Verrucomicrobiota bacterium]